MKTFEVQIKKDRTAKECSFVWPEWWGEVNQGIDVVAYEDHPKTLGKATEGAVCVCNDVTWAVIASKNDKAITLLTEIAANEKGRAWRPQVIRITNQEAVLLVVSKAVTGKALTAKEKKVLDSEDTTPGVGKSPLFDVRKICQDKGGDLVEADLQA